MDVRGKKASLQSNFGSMSENCNDAIQWAEHLNLIERHKLIIKGKGNCIMLICSSLVQNIPKHIDPDRILLFFDIEKIIKI